MDLKPTNLQTSTPVTDFFSWFEREFLKRRKKNENYSIRAFANYLGLAAPTVSHLLAKKRTPSAKFAAKLFLRLEATPQEQEIILSALKQKRGVESSKLKPAKNHDYQMIALDSFKLLADWYHYAILELTSVKDFKSDYAWIANQIGISVPEARQAIERLLRLDLIEEKNHSFVKTNAFVTNYDEGVTNTALKQLQRYVLQKALEAIDVVGPEEKDITSMTMAIDEKKIPEAKKIIRKFRRDLCEFLEDGEQTRVFNLGIQLYPISKKSRN
jgi:uncharacterized protein (TIGR02147 family)